MAQVPATSYESTSLGDVAEFTIPFPFLSRAEVFVTVDGAPVAFTWINDGLVQLTEVPELGAVVRRYRSTAAYVPLHQFSQGVPFLPRYVDRDFKQTLYAVQESVNDTAGTSALALDTAELALDTAQDALTLVGERTQYMVLGPYGPGLHFQTTSQVFSYLGEFYAPGPAITLPYTTTGAGAGEVANFRSVGDAVLRQDLASDLDALKGAALVGFNGGTVADYLSTYRVAPLPSGGDDTVMLQSAIDAAATAKVKLVIPPLEYVVTPSTLVDWEGTNYAEGQMLAGILMRSDMDISAPGATFKIANNVSTDALPKRMAMFFTNSQLSNVRIDGLTMDMNGASNPISPSRPTTYSLFQQAQIMCSGTTGGGTLAARMDNVTVENCKLINSPGVSCIVMQQSNSLGIQLSDNWLVRNNLFYNNGIDTDDHSSVFGWAQNVIGDGNTFDSPTMWSTVGRTGGRVAWEIAGPNQRFVNNKVKNYHQGNWVAPNYTADTDNVIIANNTYSPIAYCAVDIYRVVANSSLVKKVLITANTVGIDDSFNAGEVEPQLKTAFQLSTLYGCSDIKITNNIMSKIGTGKASAGFNLTNPITAGEKHTGIEFTGNTVIGYSVGVNINTSATASLGEVVVSNNTMRNLTAAGIFAEAVGISVAGTLPVDALAIQVNRFYEDRPAPVWQRGILITGTVSNLDVGQQVYKNLTVANYAEAGSSVGFRNGEFNSLGYVPAWKSGAAAFTMGASVSAGSYAIRGKKVIANIQITLGAGVVIPAGQLNASLPITSANGLLYMGTYRIIAAGVFYAGIAMINPTDGAVYMIRDGGSLVTGTVPATLVSGASINIQVTYSIP